MVIRGKARTILDDSITNALLAVELYNKPKLDGRIQSYIVHMIIAWTKLMHAYFYKTIGDKYYYKKNGKYIKIDGERKTWELSECIKKYNQFSEAVKQNLNFFIKLRNKIEHSYINCSDIELKIFGECQSLLYNYENFIINHFGDDFSINTSLPFSLQFSQIRNDKSYKSSKNLLSREMVRINEFIDNYRANVPDEIFNLPEFSIKLIQIPAVSNTNKNDLAIQFVNWDKLDEQEKSEINKLTSLIKNKNKIIEVANVEKFLPGKITNILKSKGINYSVNTNTYLTYIFSIKPSKKWEKDKDKFDTNSKYCIYDETHDDYLYTKNWIDFVEDLFIKNKISTDKIKEMYFSNTKIDISEYE